MKQRLGTVWNRYFRGFEWQDLIAKIFFKLSGISILVLLLLIFWFLFKNSLNFFLHIPFKDFFFNTKWGPTSAISPEYGILSMLVSTVIVTGGSTLFAGLIGIVGAIFLSEYFPRSLSSIVRSTVEIFSAVPSVVIGLIGITIIAPFVQKTFGLMSMFNGYITCFLVGLMALPTVMTVSLDALNRVSQNLRIASMGLGTTKWETIYKIVLPSAKPGLITAVMLGMGRAVGETMIVLMIAGNSLKMPMSLSEPLRTITSTIAIEMGEASQTSLQYSALFALGLILFIFTFLINFFIDKIAGRKEHL